MKKVFYLRHAKSSWSDPIQADIERPLNPRGRRDAPFIATKLKEYLSTFDLKIDTILCSTSVRTTETIELFTENAFYAVPVIYDNKLYHASAEYLVNCLHQLPENHSNVIVCSHNPGTSYLAYEIDVDAHNIPTCGVFECNYKVNSWLDVSTVNASKGIFLYPKKYRDENR